MSKNSDKNPSISNILMQKSSTKKDFDESAMVSQIKRFLSSRNKRSYSDNMNFESRKMPSKPKNQAKTFINPSKNIMVFGVYG